MEISLIAGKKQISVSWIIQDIEIMQSKGWQVNCIPVRDWCPTPQNLIWLIRNLRKVLHADVVFAWFALPVSVLIARALDKPIVLNAVGSEVALDPDWGYGLPQWWYARTLVRMGLKKADSVIAISKESARWAKRWSARDVTVIYEGIDTTKFKCTSRDESSECRSIAIAAYLTSENIVRKGIPTLLEAFKLVHAQLPNTKLVIVGEKMDGYPVLINAARALGISEAVDFKGHVDLQELLETVCAADVYAMPSLHEGFPTALCEALSCRVPIVTTDRPAMNEVFTDRLNALLVEARKPVQLANAIVALLTDKNLARTIANNGRKLVETRYSRELRADKLTNYLSTAVRMKRDNHGMHFMWLVVFGVLCVITPPIVLIHKRLHGERHREHE
jgi:glycosyltransferase involved in cell wall biosynthesis